MSNESHYPTIVKLKVVEKEIAMYKRMYQTIHETYLLNITHKNWSAALGNLVEMDEILSLLVALIQSGEELLEKAIKEGGIDQKIVSYEKPRLQAILSDAQKKQKEVEKLQADLLNVEGDMAVTHLDQKSNYLEMIAIIVIGIVVMVLTIKSVVEDEPSFLDNAILAIIIGLALYYLIKKYA